MKYFRTMVLGLTLLAGGCATDSKTITEAANVPVPPDLRVYRIGVSDTVNVSVWQEEALSVSVPVRPDGKISVPLAGDVQAAGKTTQEVAQAVEKSLSGYLRSPKVTIIVTDLKSSEFLSRVRVTGAVIQQISIPHSRGMTVLDAILEAGGVNEFAASSETKLYRKIGTKTEVIAIELDEILNEGSVATNVELMPGDVITVPERFF